MTLKHRNFKAWIYCENTGEILEEYKPGPDREDERVYTCWIASEAGKRFTVHWESLMKDVCDNRGVTFLDGVETHSYVNTVSSNKGGASSGVKTENGEIRPYSFSDVVLTDDDTYLGVEQSTNTDELGNITLEIYLVRARFEPIRHPKSLRRHHHHQRPRREISLYDGAIHESTKKICDHRITLGEAVSFGPPRSCNRPRTKKLIWEPYDPTDTSPHVVFRFKYRPRSYLQAQGIIPTPACIERTPAKPIILNTGTDNTPKNAGGQKRKRPLMDQDSSQCNIEGGCGLGPVRANSEFETPLFLPTPAVLRDWSQTRKGVENHVLRPVFYETPCRVKQDDNVVFLGYSERRIGIKQEIPSPLVYALRAKHEPITPVKTETTKGGSGMRLWMDSRGVIDLTMDDD